MHKFVSILLFCQIVISARIKISCPAMCRCDIFENLKRTSCINQNLAMIEELDIPKESEVLDLSNNHIRELADHTFFDMHLTSLKLLNLSHNKISQIHMNSFNGLGKLKTIDLTENSMQYILVEWLWNMHELQDLYLRKNNLATLKQGPLLESTSLKVLDLSMCNIPYISEEAFTKLPNLEYLDLSGNSLIQLKISTIKPLTLLNRLRLLNNTWNCNSIMHQLGDYCRKKQISYQDPCPKYNIINTNKFERIISAVQTTNEKNTWIYEDEGNDNNTIIKTVEVCSNITKIQDSFLMEIIKLSPLLSLLIPFIIGVLIGLLIACNVQIKPPQRVRRRSIRNRSNSKVIMNWRNSPSDHYEHLLMENAIETGKTTPIQQRKSTTHL